jgi:lipoprotein-releasing system permease protein
MYKLFLILRYLRRRLIILLPIIAVWLCVAMVLIVVSVMGGFLEMVKERTRGLLSDLIVDNETLQGFPYYQELIDELKMELPDLVEAATPAIYNYGILRVKDYNYTKPVQVVGIRLDEFQGVNDFENALYYDRYYPGTTTLQKQQQPVSGLAESGKWLLPEEYETAFAGFRDRNRAEAAKLTPEMTSPHGVGRYRPGFAAPGFEGDPLWGIIVGTDIINRRTDKGTYEREFRRGCEMILTLLPLTQQGVISASGALTVPMRYADDSYTRVYDIDRLCVYVDFEYLQDLLDMEPQERVDGGWTPARASQILIKLRDGQDSFAARDRVTAVWKAFFHRIAPKLSPEDEMLMSRVKTETWQQRQQTYIQAVEKEKILVLILFMVISLVAVVVVFCVFYLIVSHKTRDIGIIKSVGASPWGVEAIFVAYGAAVGLFGGVAGTITGVIFVRHINELQEALAWINPNLRVWNPEVYAFDRIPTAVDGVEAAIIFVVAILASMIGALIPAIQAGRVWPVKALRYE